MGCNLTIPPLGLALPLDAELDVPDVPVTIQLPSIGVNIHTPEMPALALALVIDADVDVPEIPPIPTVPWPIPIDGNNFDGISIIVVPLGLAVVIDAAIEIPDLPLALPTPPCPFP